MSYSFGKDIIYYFVPVIDDEPILNIPTQTPAIYVFSYQNKPSVADARSGTNKLGSTIAAWTARGQGFEFTIPAITDPDPNSQVNDYTYWIAINFILKSGGDTLTLIRSLEMERPSLEHEQIETTISDIISIYSDITAYKSESQILRYMSEAKSLIKLSLSIKGFEWAQIHNAKDFNAAHRYKTLELIMASLRRTSGDTFDSNFTYYKELADGYLNAIQLEYDSDKDGEPDVEEISLNSCILTR